MSLCEIIVNAEKNSKLIGAGSFSKVYKDTIENKEVAIKVIDVDTNVFYGDFDKQIRIKHPNILKHYVVATDEDCDKFSETVNRVYIVSELMSFTLGALVNNMQYPEFRNSICLQLLKAIDFIHRIDLAHLDIKPENVLLSINGDKIETKLADFGGSVYMRNVLDIPVDVNYAISFLYLPPHIVNYILTNRTRDIVFSKKFDLWAYGITAIQTLTAANIDINKKTDLNVKMQEYIKQNKININLPYVSPLLDAMTDQYHLNINTLPSTRDLLGFTPADGTLEIIKLAPINDDNYNICLKRLFLYVFHKYGTTLDTNVVFLAIHNLFRILSLNEIIEDSDIEMLIISAAKTYGFKINYDFELLIAREVHFIKSFRGRMMAEHLLYYENYNIMNIFSPSVYINFINSNNPSYPDAKYVKFADLLFYEKDFENRINEFIF